MIFKIKEMMRKSVHMYPPSNECDYESTKHILKLKLKLLKYWLNDVISKRAKDTGIGMALLLSAIKVNCVVSVCELIVDQEQER